jgi:t-SNARE complex subunit (syntaxin)
MLKESSSRADISYVTEDEMGLQDIQDSFRDDVEQIEKTVEKIRRKRKHCQSSVVQLAEGGMRRHSGGFSDDRASSLQDRWRSKAVEIDLEKITASREAICMKA